MEDRSQPLVEIVMPQLGISVTEGTLVHWLREPGDWVEADEPIAEVSSDKVNSDIPAPASGRIVALLLAVGETVDVGTVIATLLVEDGGLRPLVDVRAESGVAAASSTAGVAGGERSERLSPVVLRMAAELGVDLASVVGTGRGGRVTKDDVLAAANRGAVPQAAPPEASGRPPEGAARPYEPPPPGRLSPMRRSIGEHMKRSLSTAATVTSWIEVDFGAVEARRAALGVTALPVVAAATVATLGDFGELNAWLDGEEYTLHTDVNLGIAVSLGDAGLIVPVIPAAQRLDVAGLAERIADVARRAREHTLSADEVRDGTFTITNPGQFGTVIATPVINQPQVAILDVEAIVRRPVVVSVDGEETIAVRPICVLGLSWDHRALDGAYAARFLAALRDRLQAV